MKPEPSSLPQHWQSDHQTNYAGTDELWMVDRCLLRYNQDIVASLSAYLGNAPAILEFGAGIATLATLWRQQTGVAPDCLEIDAVLQQVIRDRGFACYGAIEQLPQSYDGIYSSNVLEHIEDDLGALKSLHTTLKPEGRVALFVPAFSLLYSPMDAALGHYRRYSMQELSGKLTCAGFTVQQCYYVDSIGFFAWLVMKWLAILSKRASSGSERSLMIYDRYLYPISRTLDRLGLRHLFGKNIMIFAVKSA